MLSSLNVQRAVRCSTQCGWTAVKSAHALARNTPHKHVTGAHLTGAHVTGAQLQKSGFDLSKRNLTFSASEAKCRFVTSQVDQRFASTDEGDVREIPVPPMGDSISEGSISHWTKGVGDFINEDEVIAVVETDKISVDILSPASGVIAELMAEEGETVFVGEPLFTISTSGDVPVKSTTSPTESVEKPKEEEMPEEPKSLRQDTVVPMSRMRQRIAERLKGAQDNAAALTTFNEVDLSALMKMRSDLNESFQKTHDAKLGFMSPFILACTKALTRCPDVNASLDGTNLVYRNYVDISVAVATPTGLMVPVIRDCQSKSFADLEKELVELAGRARKGQITLGEMQGGTFTISNGGIYGSMMGTPLLNPPQSAILGMHTITQRPVCTKSGEIVVRPMMYLAVTYDHQVIDGREAVTFLKIIKELLEDPRRLLLDI